MIWNPRNPRVARYGFAFLKIIANIFMIINPTINAKKGEMIRALIISVNPSQFIESKPDPNITAPATEPIKVWEDDEGIP